MISATKGNTTEEIFHGSFAQDESARQFCYNNYRYKNFVQTVAPE
jgi:hypothetical protein